MEFFTLLRIENTYKELLLFSSHVDGSILGGPSFGAVLLKFWCVSESLGRNLLKCRSSGRTSELLIQKGWVGAWTLHFNHHPKDSLVQEPHIKKQYLGCTSQQSANARFYVAALLERIKEKWTFSTEWTKMNKVLFSLRLGWHVCYPYNRTTRHSGNLGHSRHPINKYFFGIYFALQTVDCFWGISLTESSNTVY